MSSAPPLSIVGSTEQELRSSVPPTSIETGHAVLALTAGVSTAKTCTNATQGRMRVTIPLGPMRSLTLRFRRGGRTPNAGPTPPNPPTVACNRLLGSPSLIAGLVLGRLEAAMEKGARAHASTNNRWQQETPVSLLEERSLCPQI